MYSSELRENKIEINLKASYKNKIFILSGAITCRNLSIFDTHSELGQQRTGSRVWVSLLFLFVWSSCGMCVCVCMCTRERYISSHQRSVNREQIWHQNNETIHGHTWPRRSLSIIEREMMMQRRREAAGWAAVARYKWSEAGRTSYFVWHVHKSSPRRDWGSLSFPIGG